MNGNVEVGVTDREPERRRLLMFNLTTDADDPILSFTTEWVVEMARRVGWVDVVTMCAGRLAVPENVEVFSVGKELGHGEPRRLLTFYRILLRLLRRNHYDACFAHMMPLFALLGSPLLRARRIPSTLWYVHRAAPLRLRLATSLVDHVVTSSPDSFRVPTGKLVVTGHGIDTSRFRPAATSSPPRDRVRVLSVGRISPVKALELVVDAVARATGVLGQDGVELRLVGPLYDAGYARRLEALARSSGISDQLTIAGPTPRPRLVDEYRASTVVVNSTPTGSFDKAALEAMSSGVLLVTTNASFGPLVAEAGAPWLLTDATGESVADAILRIVRMPEHDRVSLGRRLRDIVVRDHSLSSLANHLVEHVLFNRRVAG